MRKITKMNYQEKDERGLLEKLKTKKVSYKQSFWFFSQQKCIFKCFDAH